MQDEEQGVYDDVGLPSEERVNSLYAGSTTGSILGKESEWEDLEDPATRRSEGERLIVSKIGEPTATPNLSKRFREKITRPSLVCLFSWKKRRDADGLEQKKMGSEMVAEGEEATIQGVQEELGIAESTRAKLHHEYHDRRRR